MVGLGRTTYFPEQSSLDWHDKCIPMHCAGVVGTVWYDANFVPKLSKPTILRACRRETMNQMWTWNMNRLSTRIAVFLLTALAVLGAERPDKPNIVLMLIDDLGWQDLKCYDLDEPSPYETPRIDALAKQGVLFRDAYSPAPTCAPSRCAILAGKHPARLQKTHVKGGQPPKPRNATRDRLMDPWYYGGLPVTETTIAEVLRDNGYRTGHSGKWHVAISHNAYPEPSDHGFDSTVHGRGVNAKMSPHRLTGFATAKDSDPYQLDADGFPKDSVTVGAIDFMKEAKAQPFFLYYATWLVHYPIQSRSKALLEKYCQKLGVDFPTNPAGWPLKGQRNPYYCAMVESVDHYVGQLVTYLEQTDDPRWPGHKLIENTYIIFTSDNGGAEGGPKEQYTDNRPLDQGKGSTKEGGTRVPLIIAGPGIKQGVETTVLANGVDFYRTILSWTGVALPGGISLDGCDLSALLTGDPTDANLVEDAAGNVRDAMIHHFPHGGSASSTLRQNGYKLIYNYDHIGANPKPEIELYRLEDRKGSRSDWEEAKDLAAELPEKAQALKAQLLAELDAMGASRPYLNPQTSQALPNKGKVCKPGKVEHQDNTVSLPFTEREAKVVKGYLYYTRNKGDRDEEWFREDAELREGRISAELPKGATAYQLALIDENNYLVARPGLSKKERR